MDTRARITRERRDVKAVGKWIKEQKEFYSARNMFDCVLCQIGKTVFNRIKKTRGGVRQKVADKIK